MSAPSVSIQPVRVAVIVGSTREGRRGPLVAEWYAARLATDPAFDVDVIDLLDVELPVRFEFGHHEGAAEFRDRLDRADAFVVVTPEYNHSYPASLKHAVDLAKREWERKPVAFVSYGGVSGGLRAVEQLRLVFAELRAVGIRDSVSFHGPFNGFGDHGPTDAATAEAAMTEQLKSLFWWAVTLRAGRDGTAELAA